MNTHVVVAFVICCLVVGSLGDCGTGEEACGSECYNTSDYTCFSTCVSSPMLCPVGLQCCSGACYNTSAYYCYGTTLCQNSQTVCECAGQLCPTSTPDPTTEPPTSAPTTVPPTSAPTTVPPTSAPAQSCCDDYSCYTKVYCPSGQTCCYSRPTWEESEGGFCFDSTVSTCASCPVYNPNHGQNQVCPLTAPTCCAGGCTNQKCCWQYLSYDSYICPLSASCCLNNSTCC